MRLAFPEARRPFNLAYSCADWRDLGLILPRLERSTSLKRVIISLDWTLVASCATSPLDAHYYSYDPVPDFSLEGLRLSRRIAAGGILDEPAWRPEVPDRADRMTDMPAMTTYPDTMLEVARYLETARGRATLGAPVSCDDIPVVKTLLAPFIRRMAARGVTIDLLSPPYSLAIYYEWTAGPKPFPGPPFPTAMAIRRCVLEQTAGLPNVYFHAFDADLQLTDNLSLYKDYGHITGYNLYLAVLKHIEARDHVLTLGQWPAYEARLRRDVDMFHL
jgi:hypothetical protein